uniref:Cyclin dependent kinase 2 associated protein 2 n=1 Tax=Equus caballus TaxID=9796 RepID=F7CR29_HORSE
MSYKPIAPAPSSTPGSSTPGPGTPVPTAGSVPSPSGSVPGAAAPFRPLFNDFGPPSMGYVQAMKPPGAQGSQSTYTDLLSVIEEMGKEIRPTYAGSKSAMERLKRGTRGRLSLQSAALTGTPTRVSSEVTVSFTHDLPTVLIQLELSPFGGPHHSALAQDFSPLLPDPFFPSRPSKGLSPPCLVSWATATLFSVCLLLNMPFLYK